MFFICNFYLFPFLSCHFFTPFQIPSGWGTMSQGLKGIQSVSERHSVPD